MQLMPMPFCRGISISEEYARSTMSRDTYNNAARAADTGGGALAAGADADNADGAAGQAEEDVEVAKVDTEALENGGSGNRVRLIAKYVNV